MTKFYLMTQNDCSNCETVKRMLAGPLKKVLNTSDQIDLEIIHRETSPQEFESIASTFKVQSTPALINTSTGQQLYRWGLGEVADFLRGRSNV